MRVYTKQFTTEERFWAKVQKRTSNECWLWTGAIYGSNNYGAFAAENRKNIGAHRYSYMLHKGNIPDGMLVCHACDTPACVNPEHLFIGSHSENALDRERKGRGKNNRKLSDKQVGEIRILNLSVTKLSKLYGVSRRTISDAKCGRTYTT